MKTTAAYAGRRAAVRMHRRCRHQGEDHDERERAPLGPGADVEVDVEAVLASPKRGVPEREVMARQPALARALCGQRRLLLVNGDGVNHGREVRRTAQGSRLFRLVEKVGTQARTRSPDHHRPDVKRALAATVRCATRMAESHSPIVRPGTGPVLREEPPWRQPRRAGCPSGAGGGPLERRSRRR